MNSRTRVDYNKKGWFIVVIFFWFPSFCMIFKSVQLKQFTLNIDQVSTNTSSVLLRVLDSVLKFKFIFVVSIFVCVSKVLHTLFVWQSFKTFWRIQMWVDLFRKYSSYSFKLIGVVLFCISSIDHLVLTRFNLTSHCFKLNSSANRWYFNRGSTWCIL